MSICSSAIVSQNNLNCKKPDMPHHSLYKMYTEDCEMEGVDDMLGYDEELDQVQPMPQGQEAEKKQDKNETDNKGEMVGHCIQGI